MDEEQIKAMYRSYWRYMIEKNVPKLRDMMTDDYVLIHMTGVRQSAETFLKGLADGTFNYFSAKHDCIEVQVTGDTAVMTGKSLVSAAVYGGGRHTWCLRGDFRLRKENGRWMFTSSRASTY